MQIADKLCQIYKFPSGVNKVIIIIIIIIILF